MSLQSFEAAVAFVGSSTTISTNETKLRLYALYKIATVSAQPSSSRPGIWDFSGRAKWDAWSALGKEFVAEEVGGKEKARRAYEDEARKLGWVEEGGEDVAEPVEQPPSEKKERMVGVSVLESGFFDEAPLSKLHELAIDGNAADLEAFLRENGSAIDLNERDSYGYAALHLAVDRGNLDAAKALLAAGADASLQDEDGNTPLQLAQLAEQDDLVALLSSV